MKKLLFVALVALISSCSIQDNLTSYQSHNVRKFCRTKHIRPQAGPRYIRPRKRGDITHPAVTKQTRKALFRYVRKQRTTVSN